MNKFRPVYTRKGRLNQRATIRAMIASIETQFNIWELVEMIRTATGGDVVIPASLVCLEMIDQMGFVGCPWEHVGIGIYRRKVA